MAQKNRLNETNTQVSVHWHIGAEIAPQKIREVPEIRASFLMIVALSASAFVAVCATFVIADAAAAEISQARTQHLL